MLPHGAARSPPATSMVAASCVVVVLPFVPVISIHSAGVPSARVTLSLTRHASSMSPQRAIPLCWTQRTTGCWGEKPGDAITTSGRNSRNASGTSSSGPSSSLAPMTGSRPAYSPSACSENTTTSARSSARVSATEKPVIPSPRTATRRSFQSACQLMRESRRSAVTSASTNRRRRGLRLRPQASRR